MATYTVSKSVNKTLSGSIADTVEITGQWTRIEIVNRSTSETLWISVGALPGSVPNDPTVAGDNVEPVLPSERVSVRVFVPSTEKKIVKLIGNSNPYSVIGASFDL